MLSLITKGILTERKNADIVYNLRTGNILRLKERKNNINMNLLQRNIIISRKSRLIINRIDKNINLIKVKRTVSLSKC